MMSMLLKLSISQDGLVVPGELTNVYCSAVIFVQQTKQGMKICTLRAQWQATRWAYPDAWNQHPKM